MISVVAPVFNEVAGLAEFHRRVTDALAEHDAFELILVDDGSADGSWELMLSLAAIDSRLRLVRLSRNFGHQIALTAGLEAARGDAVVLIDADLQDPPELIPELVAKWREGYDVVYAIRTDREGETRFKLWTASLFYKLLRHLTKTDIPENAGDFRLLSRRATDTIARMPERARFLRGMTSWVGFRQTGVGYRREARFAGDTKYPIRKMISFAADAILSFSASPIKLITGLGLLLVVFCIGVLGWTIYVRFFSSGAVQGWTSVIILVLLLGAMQLIGLGIIGQYVARIFEETKQRPLYVIAEIIEGGEGTTPPERPLAPSLPNPGPNA